MKFWERKNMGYHIFGIISTSAIAIIGLLYTICPSKMLKKDFRNSVDHIKKLRKQGIIFLTLGIIATIMIVIINF